MSENLGTIWVCRCCMLQHANGEHCGDAEYHGDQPEPLCLIEWPNTAPWGMADASVTPTHSVGAGVTGAAVGWAANVMR